MANPSLRNNISASAQHILANNLAWDNHGCMPLRGNDTGFLPQLARYRDAGFNVVSLNVGFDAIPWENTLLVLATFRHWIRQHGDDYILVETTADIEVAVAEGKLGVFFDLEGGCVLADQLSMVELYYDLGARWMLIAYNQNNSLGGGCQDDDQGLTAFGREVLDEMARVGMVACCSHTGYRTTMAVMEHSSKPVIFSHSNPLGLREHKRNITDDAILACAATGGVVCLNGVGIFLGENDARSETIARHIDYIVEKAGIDHVGIGLDYVFDMEELNEYVRQNPQTFPPEGGYAEGVNFVEPEQAPEMVDALLSLGYQDGDIAKILGGNLMRVARQVWK